MTVAEGELLWTPSEEFVRSTHLYRYMRWLEAERGLAFADYGSLWRWSVGEPEAFWGSLWDFFGVHSVTPYRRVLSGRSMPGARWFEGSRINYAEHLLRREAETPDAVAVHHVSEIRPLARMSWRDLGRQARILATRLRAQGVGPGDRVAAFLPNIPETLVAMLACTAIGAVWSSAAPEFGLRTVLERFSQIRPKVLFAVDGYRYAGKEFDRAQEVAEIVAALPSIEQVVWLPYLRPEAPPPSLAGLTPWSAMLAGPEVAREDFRYEYVDSAHPLWILFSSGTTGLPKPIVHGHTGMLLELLKNTAFHLDLHPESCMFFYSTTGWMMWNALTSALLQGASVVLYDGHPAHPEPDLLWRLAAETGVTSFGASPTYVQIMQKQGIEPNRRYDLSRLRGIFLAGSPSTPESFAWFYDKVKADLWMTSQSGGTEFASGLVGGVPILPVHAGEIQARNLGMDVHAWSDDGKELIDEVGELVVTTPAPSMPLCLWNDADGSRYREAYFDMFPGVWRHGDFLKINKRDGAFIYGRSDATLNRFGVRIGSAEIYRAVESIGEVADSLIVCLDLSGGRFFMPLFVRLKDGLELDDALRERIAERLRTDYSPRHVPDRIYQVAEVPYTLSNKKMEVPVRRILMGWPPEKAASRESMANPAALDFFVRFAKESRDYQRG